MYALNEKGGIVFVKQSVCITDFVRTGAIILFLNTSGAVNDEEVL